jgi:site-specific recombinase XerD
MMWQFFSNTSRRTHESLPCGLQWSNLVKLFKKPKSTFYWYDFTVGNRRYRGSTKETNKTRADAIAALKLSKAIQGDDPLPKKAPALRELAGRFLEWMGVAKLEPKTRTYYKTGWRLLNMTPLAGMRIDRITSDDVDALRFPNSPSNANCALRTLRRMLHKAEEWKLIFQVPDIQLAKEHGRSLKLDDASESKILAAAAECGWRKGVLERFRNIVLLVRDTGMRNERELYRMRIEHLDWSSKVIFVPDSKTPDGRRTIPMSDRAFGILSSLSNHRRSGWVFPSKRAASGHLTTVGKLFRQARAKAGLPEKLVLYCGRHDYGTRVLRRTGNLAAVMRTMGHRDVKTAMQYQHPELDIVRNALNQGNVPTTMVQS